MLSSRENTERDVYAGRAGGKQNT